MKRGSFCDIVNVQIRKIKDEITLPWADTGRLQQKCNRLLVRLLAIITIYSITITNNQNHNVIDYDYIESNHDYNHDYICLETSSEWKQTPFAWFDVKVYF